MGTKIHLLSDNIVNKIAAGEVVERPASVVKELVENSIDAGADKVQVSILAGGKQLIVVSDNGHGMAREDLRLSYLRHATSKMNSPSDLFNIQTLGFRGEALASIGAVAFMSIETKYIDEEEGTRLVVEGGVEREFHPMGRATGTTISVRQLFFNTPARRKFLRHIDTEARHITRTMIHLAAAYPQVGFELEHQERNVLRFTSASHEERALDLLGLDKDGALPFKIERDGVSVRGMTSLPSHCQKSKTKQYLIVRGRPIYARALIDAIYKGYAGLLPQDTHPAFLCWLDLDPRQIDVNVHPTKREIRIANERSVAEAVQIAVRQSISLGEEDEFVFSQAGKTQFLYPVSGKSSDNAVTGSGMPALPQVRDDSEKSEFLIPTGAEVPNENISVEKGEVSQGELLLRTEEMVGNTASPEFNPTYEQVWQAHDAYLICPLQDALLVVDQRAAHQRILYEEACQNSSDAQKEIQQLLFPFVLKLGREEFSVAQGLLDDLLAIGFDMREFGENTFVVDGIPGDMENWDEGAVLRRVIADIMADKAHTSEQLRETLLVSYARHAAIAEGRSLELREMRSIIARLVQCKESYVCPRGKPTMVKVMRRDLDRLFGKA